MNRYLMILSYGLFCLGIGYYAGHYDHHTPTQGAFSSGAGTSSSPSSIPAPTYYHSIPEMQNWCGAYPDGVWGMETDRMYKAKWSEQYGNMCAVEFYEVME